MPRGIRLKPLATGHIYFHNKRTKYVNKITLNTSDLVKSDSNVRAGHSKEAIHMMANSIKVNGIINPPTVAKKNGKYEIVAGQLRVAGAIAAGIKKVDCFDVTDQSVEQRVSVSLSENVIRKEMSEIEIFKAFAKLFKTGVSVEDIAKQFSYTPDAVKRVLAIGSLPKKILDAAEKDEIGDRTLRALAVASKKDVARYNKLKPSERPNDWQINDWLYADGMYPEDAAIFNLEDYTGGRIEDLFNDTVYLTDGLQFIELQSKAIELELSKLEEAGWKVTQVDYFDKWGYDKAAKKNGGQVFYTISDRTGVVEFHKGYKRKGSAGKAPAATAGKDKKEKPEISQAFTQFMDETRHAAVQAFMMQNKQAGLVATLLLLLKQCDNISFRSGGAALGDNYNDSLHSGDNFIYMKDGFDDMLAELGLKDGWTWDIDLEKLGKKLMEYTPNQLALWIIATVTRHWDCEAAKHGDAIARAVGLEVVNNWEADDAFWNGITNKKTLIAIAKETGVQVDINSTAKSIRQMLQANVPNSWRPKWLKF